MLRHALFLFLIVSVHCHSLTKPSAKASKTKPGAKPDKPVAAVAAPEASKDCPAGYKEGPLGICVPGTYKPDSESDSSAADLCPPGFVKAKDGFCRKE